MGLSPHNTNLAVKGILGLTAYSELLKLRKNESSSELFKNLSKIYYEYWKVKSL